MAIVSNSSPLILLAKIGRFNLLKQYEDVSELIKDFESEVQKLVNAGIRISPVLLRKLMEEVK